MHENPWRRDFPGLEQKVHGKPLIYFDSANTAQKPQLVIDAVSAYLREYAANVARAVHHLSERATAAYELTRDRIAESLGGVDRKEIVLTSGTTEALNLVAYGLSQTLLKPGDEVLVSEMEHHANIVPWQIHAERVGAKVVPIAISDQGELDLEQLERALQGRAKVLALTHVSNVLGTISPLAEICALARRHGVISVIDGSQALPHMAVSVSKIDPDFYAFTGHKLFAPTGCGGLYGRYPLLQSLPPLHGGGEMIREVSFSGTSYAEAPQRFEAGTPNIAGHIGLAAALAWRQQADIEQIARHEQALSAQLLEGLEQIDGLRVLGQAQARAPVFAFAIQGAHAHDIALLLDQEGIAVRSGQHCAHPLLKRMGVNSSVRVSLACYNTASEIERFLQVLRKVVVMLR
jgi:cysteine desulfurase/selenocysteine lyase